ncbi:MAG TPA: hypothetical protein VG245_11735 [Candidatus Dormibacteraeota bacterium]|jgi:hypothetical protein|nr:hypothetical protein [Candidatus Dormibacteraeota bacterium]
MTNRLGMPAGYEPPDPPGPSRGPWRTVLLVMGAILAGVLFLAGLSLVAFFVLFSLAMKSYGSSK